MAPPYYPSICEGTGNNAIFLMSPGSPQQRLTSMSAVLAFFRGNVGNSTDPDFNRNFNPWWGIPATVTDENGVVQPYPTRGRPRLHASRAHHRLRRFHWPNRDQQLWISQPGV